MAPGQESAPPARPRPTPQTPQGNQTCPTQRQPWGLDPDRGLESDSTHPRLSVGYRTFFQRSLPQLGGLSGKRASSPHWHRVDFAFLEVQLAPDFHLVCPFLRTPGVNIWGSPACRQPVGA